MRTNSWFAVSRVLTVTAWAFLLTRPTLAAEPAASACVAASNASLLAEDEHKLRALHAQLVICAASSCPGEIREECERRLKLASEALPTVIFEVKDPAGHRVTALQVTMDGELIADKVDGAPVALDPGQHTFEFHASDQLTQTVRLVILEGEKNRRQSIQLVLSASPVHGAISSTGNDSAGARRGVPSQKVLAMVSAGVGVVGLGIGTAFGLTALSRKDDAQKLCPDQCADDAGVRAWEHAKSAGNLSTAFFLLGGAGLVGAAVLWFTAPTSANSGATQVGFGLGSVRLKSSW